MLTKLPEKLEPYEALDIISEVHDTVKNLKQIQDDDGSGNILVGLGRALGAALEGALTGGSSINKAIGGAIKDTFDGLGDLDEKVVGSLGDSASKVIGSTGGAVGNAAEGFGKFFHGFLGGIGGSIKWGFMLILLGTILYFGKDQIKAFTLRHLQPRMYMNNMNDRGRRPVIKKKKRSQG